jgi:hypothetical protein
MKFIDKVNKALIEGEIFSDPVVNNFFKTLSEDIDSKYKRLLKKWTDPSLKKKSAAKIIKKFFVDSNGEPIIAKLSDKIINDDGNDLELMLLINRAMLRLLTPMAKKIAGEDEIINAMGIHLGNLSDHYRDGAFKDDKKFLKSAKTFTAMVHSQTEQGSPVGKDAESFLKVLSGESEVKSKEEEDEYYYEDDEVEEEAEEAEDAAEEAEDAVEDAKEEAEEAEDAAEEAGLLGLDFGKAKALYHPDFVDPGDEPEGFPAKDPWTPETIAKSMYDPEKMAEKDIDPDEYRRMKEKTRSAVVDPEEATRQAVKDAEEVSPEAPEEAPEYSDYEAAQAAKYGAEAFAKERVEILKVTGDKAVVRVKAVKRDRQGELHRTYRFAVVDQDTVGNLDAASIWNYLKDQYQQAKGDPASVKQYNNMFTVNLQTAYNQLTPSAYTFEEYLQNYIGGSSLSDRLMAAYSRVEKHDRYRLSGVISKIPDKVIFYMLKPIRTNLKEYGINMPKALELVNHMKQQYEGSGPVEESAYNESFLRILLEDLGNNSRKFAKIAINVLIFDALANQIVENPSMLEQYGVAVPEFAKTRGKRFDRWQQQELSNIDFYNEAERKQKLRLQQAKLGYKEPHKQKIQKMLIANFNKILKDPSKVQAFHEFIRTGGEGKLGLTEMETMMNLARAANSNKLLEFLDEYVGEPDTLLRISNIIKLI